MSTSSTSPHYLNILPPSTLPFTYVPKKFLTSSIKLTNPTSLPIVFKIRTNAPFNYLVKPRQGLILPQQIAIIDITMQPSDIDPEKTSLSDKFLINACPVEGPSQSGQVDINSVFLKAKKEIVQMEKLKVGFLVENEGSDETRDTSMCENSPVKEIKEAKESKETKEIERQESETSELNGSFCGPLEPVEETIRSNLNMMKRFVSEMEIQPRKKLELNEKVHSERMILGEKKEEQIVKIDENKVWIEKIMEQRDKLKKHLEEIKKLDYVNCVGEKVTKFAEGLSVKGDHKWQIFVVVVVFLFLGTVLR